MLLGLGQQCAVDKARIVRRIHAASGHLGRAWLSWLRAFCAAIRGVAQVHIWLEPGICETWRHDKGHHASFVDAVRAQVPCPRPILVIIQLMPLGVSQRDALPQQHIRSASAYA